MFKEFKAFVNQGNALDLAVGVLIGAAFGKIVNSMVTDIITPILSLVTGKVDFNNLYYPLNGQSSATLGLPADHVMTLEEARKGGAVIAYGAFINNVIEFFIIAFTIFLLVRQINKWRGPAPAK